MQTLISIKYADMDRIFTSVELYKDVYPKHNSPVPPEAEQLNAENDPNGFKKAEHMELVKLNVKKKRELEDNKIKVYNYIKLHLSQESWEEVKACEGYEINNVSAEGEIIRTETLEQLKDPYFIVEAIKATHSGHRTGVSTLDNDEATTGYASDKSLMRPSISI
jgi:hypothetical protein